MWKAKTSAKVFVSAILRNALLPSAAPRHHGRDRRKLKQSGNSGKAGHDELRAMAAAMDLHGTRFSVQNERGSGHPCAILVPVHQTGRKHRANGNMFTDKSGNDKGGRTKAFSKLEIVLKKIGFHEGHVIPEYQLGK